MDAEFEAIYKREQHRPLDWWKCDANMHKSRDIKAMCDTWADMHPDDGSAGVAAYGLYNLLLGNLYLLDDHCYIIRERRGLGDLMRDMNELNVDHPLSDEEVRDFLKLLASLDLIDAEAFANGMVANERVFRSVNEAAAQAAGRKAGGRAAANKRWQNAGNTK